MSRAQRGEALISSYCRGREHKDKYYTTFAALARLLSRAGQTELLLQVAPDSAFDDMLGWHAGRRGVFLADMSLALVRWRAVVEASRQSQPAGTALQVVRQRNSRLKRCLAALQLHVAAALERWCAAVAEMRAEQPKVKQKYSQEELLQLRPTASSLRADATAFVPVSAVDGGDLPSRWRPKERRRGTRSRRQRSERRACDAAVQAKAAAYEQQQRSDDAAPRQEGDRVAAVASGDLDFTALASTFFDVSRIIFGKVCEKPRVLPSNAYFAYRYARAHGLAD